ncbi:MAG: hypothetical protein ACYTGH_09555 [Planctomycetota bacterium]|jgi:hypothetical protein
MNQALLARILKEKAPQYDPGVSLLGVSTPKGLCHSRNLGDRVHPTVSSVEYALALLDSGEVNNRARSIEILGGLVNLQDRDTDSPTCGLWTWFVEETLESMVAPDWNVALFMGIPILQIVRRHGDVLPEELRSSLVESLRLAAATIPKRDCPLTYSNICACECYLSLAAGEFLDDPTLVAFGLDKLKRFSQLTRDFGGFAEYNSPHYVIIAMRRLDDLAMESGDPEVRELAAGLTAIGWRFIADRFHPGLRQWAGPHSRSYSTLLAPKVLAFLQTGLGGAAEWIPEGELPLDDMEAYRDRSGACPEGMRACFLHKNFPRNSVQVFQKPVEPNFAVREEEREVGARIGTLYMDERVCLASMRVEDGWEQRRPILAYFGTPECPGYLRVRILHDGRDLASGMMAAAQNGPYLLAAAGLVTDNGDSHTHLDPIENGVITASDLRLRVELGGPALDCVPLPAAEELHRGAALDVEGLGLQLQFLGQGGAHSGVFEVGRSEGLSWCDRVWYSGPKQDLNLHGLTAVSTGLALSLGTPRWALLPRAVAHDGTLDLEWEEAGLSLTVPAETSRWKDWMALTDVAPLARAGSGAECHPRECGDPGV